MSVYKRALAPAAVAVTAAVFLAACGGAEDGSTTGAPESSEQSATEFNDADVSFAQMMIPHHEQAVEMSELAQTRAGEDVRGLAAEIEAAQGPEIDQMTGLLESWGEEPMDDMGGMDHGGMDGMMSEDQMADLEQAEGDAFDTMFLEMMIEHHEGAIAMAETEIEQGADPEAQELAQEIVDAQRTEIEQMNDMLGTGGGDSGAEESSPEDDSHSGH
ncbi:MULTISPECIES: DUF305 domain-containing protein [Nocardiopsis]|uniref:DUF305 domain-containing protein n=1 Tax=Nocardiopsis lambiniae TaxID=3075539 RepID=A0ABU2MAY2_9ACTN|nr:MULTISPECIES: DUF305 domain-containing protein [unclassified Nocardiopsis]MDE3724006.1 DUF305 domain-containing protein [Nocardiopsis sp. N85]MDT0329839.1 DUF305 domain-containing protein [Nocardiopsis sp. DSM 44743]